ncbi:hypothetical protein [Janibacter melonis]|uniref:hypothetical protein n=1 Tax=Janibacter melonis TaxID=262209 RepID=UPI001919DED0|nr:hypothetical protein [Janibacter melonis]
MQDGGGSAAVVHAHRQRKFGRDIPRFVDVGLDGSQAVYFCRCWPPLVLLELHLLHQADRAGTTPLGFPQQLVGQEFVTRRRPLAKERAYCIGLD